MRAAAYFDGEQWREGAVRLDVDGRVRVHADSPPPGTPRLVGRLVGGFTDHHVHLQLVDTALLGTSRLGRVVDLGGNPEVLRRLAVNNSCIPEPPSRSAPPRTAAPTPGGTGSQELFTDEMRHPVDVRFAGAFLTAPGGYPSDRAWAPGGSVREVADAEAATATVEALADAGASCIKVASNSTAGPVLSDDLFRAVVAAADGRALPVVAHAEGRGEAQRVVRLGAVLLAHAPFTERLDDAEVARQARTATWISTIAVHDPAARATAVDNVRRFHAAGGTVHYGTDMGNGPTPVDLNPAEVAALREAGLDDAALLRALGPTDPRRADATLLLLPDGSSDPLDARPVTAADLKV